MGESSNVCSHFLLQKPELSLLTWLFQSVGLDIGLTFSGYLTRFWED